MFVNTVLQNPLGTSLTQAQAHRLLGVAEQFDFWLVEDDIYRELAARGEASLAAMDGLRRVIRVGSFSKTLSPVLRVGSICASNSLVPELLRVKMLAGLTTSEINERAVYHAMSARPYKRMVEKLVDQLKRRASAPSNGCAEAGMAPIAKPRGGMFVSAGWQQRADARVERQGSSPTRRSRPASCCRRTNSSCCAPPTRSGSASTSPMRPTRRR